MSSQEKVESSQDVSQDYIEGYLAAMGMMMESKQKAHQKLLAGMSEISRQFSAGEIDATEGRRRIKDMLAPFDLPDVPDHKTGESTMTIEEIKTEIKRRINCNKNKAQTVNLSDSPESASRYFL